MASAQKRQSRYGIRYSLRTLFALLTVFCLWLGFQYNWIHQRHAARHWVEDHAIGGSIGFFPESRPELPWSLRLLGEQPELLLVVGDVADDRDGYASRVEEIRRLFPEAQVVDMSQLQSRPWPDV